MEPVLSRDPVLVRSARRVRWRLTPLRGRGGARRPRDPDALADRSSRSALLRAPPTASSPARRADRRGRRGDRARRAPAHRRARPVRVPVPLLRGHRGRRRVPAWSSTRGPVRRPPPPSCAAGRSRIARSPSSPPPLPVRVQRPGGDTASALAAGCPVVVKAHSRSSADQRAWSRRRCGPRGEGRLRGRPHPGPRLPGRHRPGAPPAVRRRLHWLYPRRSRSVRPRRRAAVSYPVLRRARSLNRCRHRAGRGKPAATRSPGGLVASYTLGQGQFCTSQAWCWCPPARQATRLRARRRRQRREPPPGALLDARSGSIPRRVRRPAPRSRRPYPGGGGRRAHQ